MQEADALWLSDEDANHVNLLGIFHYVLGGITLVFAFCPSLHLTLGIAMLMGGLEDEAGEAPPVIFGVIFTVIPVLLMITGWVLGGVMLYAAGCLRQHQRLTLCQVLAGTECIFMPFGTVLGVLTLIVLNRPQVRAAFDTATTGTASPRS